MFSVGLVAAKTLHPQLRHVFAGDAEAEARLTAEGAFPSVLAQAVAHLTGEARALVAQMLSEDPSQRPTMAEVLAHNLFNTGHNTATTAAAENKRLAEDHDARAGAVVEVLAGKVDEAMEAMRIDGGARVRVL